MMAKNNEWKAPVAIELVVALNQLHKKLYI
jgi:hypothetical protein